MFERYTDAARRTLFFARYEASQTGSRAIETEHLLLGLLRDVPEEVAAVFERAHVSADELRGDVNRRVVLGETVPTSVEIPFSATTKRVLQRAAEEADGLGHSYIGTEHLLLGLLAEGSASMGGSVLAARGVRLADTREVILARADTQAAQVSAVSATLVFGDAHAHITNIGRLVAELVRMSGDSPDAHRLAQSIGVELEQLRSIVR